MIRYLAVSAALLGCMLLIPPARAQSAQLVAAPSAMAQPPTLLTYSQPLAPNALREVQGKLAMFGAYAGPVDGNWGVDSTQALRNFQQGHGLQVTGEMNQATAATLGLDPAGLVSNGFASSPPSSMASAAMPFASTAPMTAAVPSGVTGDQTIPMTSDSIRVIQARMRQLGLYTGPIDGVWGGSSVAAFRAFQQSMGLPPDGRLTGASVSAALGLDSGVPVASAPLPPPAPPAPPPAAVPAPAADATAAPPASPPAGSPSIAVASAAPAPMDVAQTQKLFDLSATSVRIIQARLRQMGLYDGDVDGVWGGQSLAAYKLFQRAHGFPPDGRLTQSAVQSLGIDPSAMQPR